MHQLSINHFWLHLSSPVSPATCMHGMVVVKDLSHKLHHLCCINAADEAAQLFPGRQQVHAIIEGQHPAEAALHATTSIAAANPDVGVLMVDHAALQVG